MVGYGKKQRCENLENYQAKREKDGGEQNPGRKDVAGKSWKPETEEKARD